MDSDDYLLKNSLLAISKKNNLDILFGIWTLIILKNKYQNNESSQNQDNNERIYKEID